MQDFFHQQYVYIQRNMYCNYTIYIIPNCVVTFRFHLQQNQTVTSPAKTHQTQKIHLKCFFCRISDLRKGGIHGQCQDDAATAWQDHVKWTWEAVMADKSILFSTRYGENKTSKCENHKHNTVFTVYVFIRTVLYSKTHISLDITFQSYNSISLFSSVIAMNL